MIQLGIKRRVGFPAGLCLFLLVLAQPLQVIGGGDLECFNDR